MMSHSKSILVELDHATDAAVLATEQDNLTPEYVVKALGERLGALRTYASHIGEVLPKVRRDQHHPTLFKLAKWLWFVASAYGLEDKGVDIEQVRQLALLHSLLKVSACIVFLCGCLFP
jgi:hypothetical protein